MRKKVCSKCGKIINSNERCGCKHYYPKSQIKKRSESTKALSRKKWLEKRKKIIRRDNHLCQRCLIKYKRYNFDNLQVHHIKSREHYPELMYDDDNLTTLCQTCNIQLGVKDELDFEWENKEEEINL